MEFLEFESQVITSEVTLTCLYMECTTPPPDSSYSDARAAPGQSTADLWNFLTREVLRQRKEGYVMIMGDFNAHTGTQTEEHGGVDDELLMLLKGEALGQEKDVEDFVQGVTEEGMGDTLHEFHVDERTSKCTHKVDDEGTALLMLCLTARLVIMNGRFGYDSGNATCITKRASTVVDYICVDDRLLKYVIECSVIPDVCPYTGDMWTCTSVDHLPVCVDLSLGLARRFSNEVHERLQRALSHLRCLAHFDEWRDEVYSQKWSLRWKPSLERAYNKYVHEWMIHGQAQGLFLSTDSQAHQPTDQVSKLLTSLTDYIWIAADNASMVRKEYCALNTTRWGVSDITIPVGRNAQIDDLVQYEQGYMPRRLWWDTSCDEAQRLARKAEHEYRVWQRKLVNICSECVNPDERVKAKAEADARRVLYLSKVREVRKLGRKKEIACRVERRNQLMNMQGSKRFWQQVAVIDSNHIAERLNKLSNVTNTGPSINAFEDHFRSISCPPACTWFDDSFHDLVGAVVRMSLHDIDHTKCDWNIDGSEFRAQVQSMLAEADRRNDGQGNFDEVTRSLTQARATLNGRITLSEYRLAKKRMHMGKAVGVDGIPFEMIRGKMIDGELISEFDDTLVHMFNLILCSGKYPDAWRLAVMIPLLKGISLDASLPTNYRGITLLSSLSKLFANIIEKRLTNFQWETESISKVQFGFTRDRRTLDPVFILDTLIDQARASKSQLYVAFVDFQKAYDFVFLDGLFYKMLKCNMIGPVYKVIHSMYQSVSAVVRQGYEVSDVIHQHVGLRQGCVLSPCLFSLFIADFPAYLKQHGCAGVLIHDESVPALFYADDGALLATSPADLQKILDALCTYCAKWRVFVNCAKTQVVVFNHVANSKVWKDTCPVFTYNSVRLEVVEEFKYLGVYFHARIKETCCIQHRLAQAKRLVAAWMRRCEIWCFKPETVINQFKTCVLPALEYGIGVWGCGKYESTIWHQVEIFWRYIARCILGYLSGYVQHTKLLPCGHG